MEKSESELDYTRADSGVDSLRGGERAGRGERFGPEEGEKGVGTEERVDSAYGSSSLTVDSLSEIIQTCSLSEPQPEHTEEEENLLSTITEDGDT